MVDGIKLLLTNQLHEYRIAMGQAQLRYPAELHLPVFNEIAAYITPYALRLIAPEYRKLTEQCTAINRCTKAFSTTTGLPCSHKIQERLYRNEAIKLEDCHVHWR